MITFTEPILCVRCQVLSISAHSVLKTTLWKEQQYTAAEAVEDCALEPPIHSILQGAIHPHLPLVGGAYFPPC